MIHTFQRLRDECLARATRPFLARGGSIRRCSVCLLGQSTCICPWRLEMQMDIDIILVMHRDEVFKPTNTGRLIGDVFPGNTYVYPWSRTEPPEALLAHLAKPESYPVIVFPPDPNFIGVVHTEPPSLPDGQTLTLVLLDGTWKQARKMFKTSRWLHRFPLMTLVDPQQGCYAVRQAPVAGQLSTAEATVAVLQQCGRTEAAQLLGDYFGVFNQHYVAARMSTPAGRSVHHQRIEDLQQSRLPR